MTTPPSEKPQETLLSALLAVQKELPSLKLGKDSSGQIAGRRDYKYLGLDKLHDAVLPLLNKHGLVWTTEPTTDESGNPILAYCLAFSMGETIRNTMPLMLDKPTMQQLGSAITYARRYSLLSVLGAVADEDDDGAKASQASPTHTPPPTPIDRPLTAEELANMREAIKASGHDEALLFASVGVEDVVCLSHARAIKAKLANTA